MVHGEISLSRSWLAMVTGFKISNVGASGQGASAHELKEAKIKGSNIYTVERGPKTAGASTNVACW